MNERRDLLLAACASLVAGAAIGLIAGVLFTRAVLFDRGFGGPPPRGPFAFRRAGPEGGPPPRFLARRLGLTREQEARVDSVLRDSRARFDSLRAETRAALVRELTPDQRTRWEQMDRRLFRPHLRPEREPGPPEHP